LIIYNKKTKVVVIAVPRSAVGIFLTCKYFATENWEIHTFLLGKKVPFFAVGIGPFNGPK
jgi:hypothetical protein